jgi:hypothetical protein
MLLLLLVWLIFSAKSMTYGTFEIKAPFQASTRVMLSKGFSR